MATIALIKKPREPLFGEVHLSGSKSISNRVLIIKALTEGEIKIMNLSTSEDTQTLDSLISSKEAFFDAGHGGTTFRFLCSFLAFKQGSHILTGSERMKQRPINGLVNALITIGANISYLEKEGFPPLQINSPSQHLESQVSINARVSSQFVSSLCMIAPSLPNGLVIKLEGKPVSSSYIKMTLDIMNCFGVNSSWEGNLIGIPNQKYTARSFFVEGDWSSASYLYGFCALNPGSRITINNLFPTSLQGDSLLSDIFEQLGVQSSFIDQRVVIEHRGTILSKFESDLINHPDLAQTFSVVCAALGLSCHMRGLQTLSIKETDRIEALKIELKKAGIKLTSNDNKDEFVQHGKADGSKLVSPFHTHGDHRMAMALSLLSSCFDVQILDPEVVIKSYPEYWKDLIRIGLDVEMNEQN